MYLFYLENARACKGVIITCHYFPARMHSGLVGGYLSLLEFDKSSPVGFNESLFLGLINQTST
jgi:hypothetical protein